MNDLIFVASQTTELGVSPRARFEGRDGSHMEIGLLELWSAERSQYIPLPRLCPFCLPAATPI